MNEHNVGSSGPLSFGKGMTTSLVFGAKCAQIAPDL